MDAHVGLLTVELYIPEALTLKDKRQVLRRLLDRAAARFNVSVAEIDYQDKHRRALIAFACVSNQVGSVQRHLNDLLEMIEAEPRAEVLEATVDLL